ncbi:MAG: putative methyltransferase [Lysobacterales bacterium]|jgi:predicted methyltransferase
MIKSLSLLAISSLLSMSALAGENPSSLDEVLAAQPEEVQARYGARHTKETIEFFGLKPGMTVMEALPGGGWYSKILIPYLGSEGHLIGADYAEDMYPRFGFFAQEELDKKKTWVVDWTAEASAWIEEGGATVSAFQLGSMPDEMKETADAVFLVRALHNLARFEPEGEYLTKAVEDSFNVLKPGGVLGVVQHKARDEMPDDWANGSRGYLKESFVIETLENAGFVLEASSDMNNNAADQPTTDDIVWRLPPTLATSRENEELKAEMTAIGESNRMTLRFRKPE